MSTNLTTTPPFPTASPSFTNSSSSLPLTTTSTDANGDIETITSFTVVDPTDGAGTQSAPPAPTSSNTGVRLGGGKWVVALLGVCVVMGFM